VLALDMIVQEELRKVSRIPELNLEPKQIYLVSSAEKILDPLIRNHDIIVVGGAFFGDEAKGKSVAGASRNLDVTMVLRSNSGANAGHTVYFNGKKYVFHNVPSAMLEENVTNYIGAECVVDPVALMNDELSQLINESIDYKDRLFIGNVQLVTPYHRLMDLVKNLPDEIPEDLNDLRLNNASTLQGISPVHESKIRKTGLRLNDLFGDEERQKEIIEKDMLRYVGELSARGIDKEKLLEICEHVNKDKERIPEHIINFLKADDKAKYLVDLYKETVIANESFPEMRNVKHEIQARLEEGEKLLIEGPQSYWLSNKVENYWGSATSPDTTLAGVLSSAGVNIQDHPFVLINVHKAPGSSRVGRGANPTGHVPQTYYSDQGINKLSDLPDGACTDFNAIQKLFWDSIGENGILNPIEYKDDSGTYLINEAMAIAESIQFGEKGATTEKPRVTCLFDCVAHAAVMREQGPYTSISAVDRGDDYDKIGMAIAYVYMHSEGKTEMSNGKKYNNGDIIKCNDPYPTENVLAHCHPIVKVMEGWKDEPIAADKRDSKAPLPLGVHNFLAHIEYFTGAEIISIGNGPETDNLIYLKKE
jgi:adenylosuccinate synthase